MSASVGGAVKAWLETAGLGIAVYRRSAPEDASYPYVTVNERVAVTPEAHGDNGADAAVDETIQVNIWQRVEDESHTLFNAVYQRLHGSRLPAGPTHVYGVTVDFGSAVPDPDDTVLHDQLTCSVRRALQEA